MTESVTIFRDVVASGEKQFDIKHLLDQLQLVGVGTLSDEHSASSYGQPVLLFGDRVYGISDIPSTWRLAGESELSEDATLNRDNPHPLFDVWNRLRNASLAR